MAETAATRSDKEARRAEILAVAFAEFTEKGYAGASMGAIARRAKASKETLYAWFANKKTLFDTLYVHQLDQVRSGATVAMREDPSPQNVLPVIARDVIKLVITMAPLSSAALAAGAQAGALARQMGRAISDERKNFVSYLNWCREQGYIAFD